MSEYTLKQVAASLSIDAATLRRWLKRAQITPRQDVHDKRRYWLTDDQVKTLRRAHQYPTDSAQRSDKSTQAMQQQIDSLRDTVNALQSRLDALELRDNTQVPQPPITRPTHTPRTPTALPADIPPDAIPLYQLAQQMNVKRKRLIENVVKYELPHIEGKSNRAGETPRFVTPEQAQYIRQWWQENKP